MKLASLLVLLATCAVAGAGCGGGDDDDGAGGAGSGGSGGTSGGSLCDRGCTATLAADCPNGPASHDACVSTCEALSSGSCMAEYAAFQACADGKTITCDPDSGIPVVEACAAEQDAFIACLT